MTGETTPVTARTTTSFESQRPQLRIITDSSSTIGEFVESPIDSTNASPIGSRVASGVASPNVSPNDNPNASPIGSRVVSPNASQKSSPIARVVNRVASLVGGRAASRVTSPITSSNNNHNERPNEVSPTTSPIIPNLSFPTMDWGPLFDVKYESSETLPTAQIGSPSMVNAQTHQDRSRAASPTTTPILPSQVSQKS